MDGFEEIINKEMLEIENSPRWISSLGGPLILMERLALANWNGDLGHEVHPWMDFVSDYDRACAVEDYIGVVKIDHGEAVVLGDLPSQTSYVPAYSGTFFLVRWIWAENEEQVLAALQNFDINQPWTDTKISISFELGELVLFDSVYSGRELEESIDISTEPGTYGIATLSYQPNAEVNLFLIKLSRVYV